MNKKTVIKFQKLCLDLRAKGILRTEEEIFDMMINLTKKHFRENRKE